MSRPRLIPPFLDQLRGDPLGLGRAARSNRSKALTPRTKTADRVIKAREDTWEEETDNGEPLKRTLGIHFLGGATLDSEENYLIKKFFTAAGAVSIENQARI